MCLLFAQTSGVLTFCWHLIAQEETSVQSLILFLQMTEMEISRAAAERSLREHMGNVVEALIALTN